ncbi:hypothetical protein [Streptomyces noursei]|uniref:hypothetical protein n=1 Tax=Streptomyces noursei TaxID=1971 RepID=UPI0019626BB4|nr:hypothetical protein [Streptomyces noursei]QRX89933.1 hypothetical protein JNO44_02815 [Streptomyces noursei]
MRPYTYRALVEQPGLIPVQPQWMHNTVLHSGPQNTATTAEVDQFVAEVTRAAAGIEPFDLALARPDIGTVAIESKGYPGAQHRRLWEMTWRAQQAVVGDRWPLIPTQSYPHLSHAYELNRIL